MGKKEYFGLDIEKVSMGEKDIDTISIWHVSGCYMAAVSYYHEDDQGNQLPLGVCWEKNEDGSGGYSFDWRLMVGGIGNRPSIPF